MHILQLVTAAAACFDELPDCPERAAKGMCLKGTRLDTRVAVHTMARCRVSCRKHIDREKAAGRLNKEQIILLENLGGTGDVMESTLGGSFNLCNLDKGWTWEARKNYLHNRNIGSIYTYSSGQSTDLFPPPYTELGFKKIRAPPPVWDALMKFYRSIKTWEGLDEPCKLHGIHNCTVVEDDGYECKSRPSRTKLVHWMDQPTKDVIREHLQPMVEEWTGVDLVFEAIFGIRRYLRGGWVGAHTDKADNKTVGFILNVGQDTDGHPWPLRVKDHKGKIHELIQEAGDVVFYEAGRVIHGREDMFEGKYYDNILMHLYPDNAKTAIDTVPDPHLKQT